MANNILTDYQKMKEERERRDSQYDIPELLERPEDEYDPMADIDDMLKNLRLSKKTATANKLLEEANADEYNPLNMDTEARDSIESIKKENKLTDDILSGKEEPEEVIVEELSQELEKAVVDSETPKGDVRPEPMERPLKNDSKDSDEGLDEARRQRDIINYLAMATEGAQKAGRAYGGGSGAVLTGESNVGDTIRNIGETNLADYKEDKATKAEQKKADKEAAKQERLEKLNTTYKLAQISKLTAAGGDTAGASDPTSESSKLAQQQAMSLMDSLNIKYNPENIKNLAADTLGSKNFTAGLRKATSKIQEKREERLTDKFGYQKTEKFEDDARQALKDMRATDTWKTAEKTLSDIPSLNMLLDDAYAKGGQSLAMLGPKVARSIANEVGVLTEQDVTRYVKNPELVGGLVDDIKKATQGKISETSYDNLKRLLEISEKSAQGKMDSAMDRESKLFSRREDMDYDDARHFIDSEFTTNVERSELTGQDKEAYDWAKANKDDPRAKAILEKLGME